MAVVDESWIPACISCKDLVSVSQPRFQVKGAQATATTTRTTVSQTSDRSLQLKPAKGKDARDITYEPHTPSRTDEESQRSLRHVQEIRIRDQSQTWQTDEDGSPARKEPVESPPSGLSPTLAVGGLPPKEAPIREPLFKHTRVVIEYRNVPETFRWQYILGRFRPGTHVVILSVPAIGQGSSILVCAKADKGSYSSETYASDLEIDGCVPVKLVLTRRNWESFWIELSTRDGEHLYEGIILGTPRDALDEAIEEARIVEELV